jgi:hypothetical protein
MLRETIDELIAKSSPEWAAKHVGSAIGKFAKENAHRVPKERKNLEQPSHKPKDPVLRNMADRVQKVGEHMRSHYKMKPGEFEKYQGMAHAEASRAAKSMDELTADYFVKCNVHAVDDELAKGTVVDFAEAKKKKEAKDDGGIKRIPMSEVDWSQVKPAPRKETAEGQIHQIDSSSMVTPHYKDRDTKPTRVYKYDKDKQEVSKYEEKKDEPFFLKKKIPANAGREEELKNASTTSDLVKSIDALLEKAGIRQVHRIKDSGAASPVRHRTLTEEQKKKYIEGSAAKVKAYRTEGYMPDKSDSPEVREQDKDASNKSLDERTADLAKSEYLNIEKARKKDSVIPFNKLKTKNEHWLDKHEKKQDISPSEQASAMKRLERESGVKYPTAKEIERMQSADVDKSRKGPMDKGDYIAPPAKGSKTYNNPEDSQDPKIRYGKFHDVVLRSGDDKKKSIDEITCDLVKSLDSENSKRIRDAAMTVRLHREGISDAASKMDVDPDLVQMADSKLSGIQAARQAQKSVVDKWQSSSSFVTKGSRVLPLGPGGEVSTLSKDDDEDEDDKKDD